jgi:erythritol transport system substrate-binding protein
VFLAESAVEQADQYIKTGKTEKDEKQTIDCILITPDNVQNYSAFSLKE